MRADRDTRDGQNAITMTVGCLAMLDAGQVPTWQLFRSRPGDPTPTYDQTVAVLNTDPERMSHEWYWALEDAEGARVAAALDERADRTLRSVLSRVPIPSRPLSYRAAARRTDPDTSHQAARSVNVTSAAHQRILHVLTEHGPQTDQDLHYQWGLHAVTHDWDPISPSGLRSRRKELVDAGLVVDSGQAGRTASGRACIVWKLA